MRITVQDLRQIMAYLRARVNLGPARDNDASQDVLNYARELVSDYICKRIRRELHRSVLAP